MHGPDGTDYPVEHVFLEVTAPERVVFRHLVKHGSDHGFEMTLTFAEREARTVVGWRQRFDSVAECRRVAPFVVEATEQNLDRLASEAQKVGIDP